VEDIARVFLDWHVLLIAGCLLFIIPLVFFISSLDKTPVKVKRVRVPEKKQAARKIKTEPPPDRPEPLRRERRRAPTERPPAQGRAPGPGQGAPRPPERQGPDSDGTGVPPDEPSS
jgi:hypothetical protein